MGSHNSSDFLFCGIWKRDLIPQNLSCNSPDHSTPGFELASFILFLIFGAERTPFALNTLWIQRGETLTAESAPLRVDFCNFLEVQNYSRNLTVFALRKGPTGLFGGNLTFFTNKDRGF